MCRLNQSPMKNSSLLIGFTAIAVFAIVNFAMAATTISTNIQTDGQLSVGTTSTALPVAIQSPYTAASATQTFGLYDSGGELRTALSSYGGQDWFLNGGSGDIGAVTIGTPTGLPGIIFWSNVGETLNRFDVKSSLSAGFQMGYVGSNSQFFVSSSTNPSRTAIEDYGSSNVGYFSIDSSASAHQDIFTINPRGSVGIGVSSPSASLEVATSTSNATTTVVIGKASQNKGSCLVMYDAAGAVKYVSIQAGAFVISATACN
jgi:hypothetical protein